MNRKIQIGLVSVAVAVAAIIVWNHNVKKNYTRTPSYRTVYDTGSKRYSERLDSIISGSDKYRYGYDSCDRVILSEHYSTNGSVDRTWHGSSRTMYTYQPSGLREEKSFDWSYSKKKWIEQGADSYNVITPQNVFAHIVVSFFKVVSIFTHKDIFGMPVEEKNQTSERYREDTLKTINGRIDSIITRKYEGSDSYGVVIERESFSYDGAGRKVEHTDLYGISDMGDYRDYKKECFSYDAAGNMLTSERFTENTEREWNNVSKDVYTYDNLGNMLTKTEYQGNCTIWNRNIGYRYTYDTSIRNQSIANYTQQFSSNNWTSADSMQNKNKLVKQEWFRWDSTEMRWIPQDTTIYYYSKCRKD